ncbi:asparagine synthase (glutamine-hydrolysing) [Algoriphagus faecimaris]|uniref:asparagine synthase (glutamine-hydrolyzing) n=1 Tax=Algoriphagus faecimaris TaxID=686796 RepID=A0A1G6WKX7_9BACT|nr:asparagine synthase (glutamine-hydrolyzing) [Algoriphagus faecimaris]SDD66439.1 asparagine synthase (glutamine-hydrolysing) [Algoriphagus faecimaris]
MCGIHLIWGKGANEEAIKTLMESAAHRGPDQSASYSPWPGLWLGVNRLKILHPGPDADQPFWSPDGRSLLIWNGEIYNYKELRDLLQKMGVSFLTHSDTEVVLHWLRIFGAKGLEKLQGMFALAYVDLSAQQVLVARDKNGEKPLYFMQTQETFILSSESRGIAKLTQKKLDQYQLDYYFYLRTPQPGRTFYKGIKEWKPSRFSEIKQHSAFRWDNIPQLAQKELPQNRESFKKLLQKAIEKQFHAEAPVGMMLSGGADSSLLYALWYRSSGRALPTYTIQSEKKHASKYADGNFSASFAKQFPMEHHLIPVDEEVFLRHLEDYLMSLDFPVGDSASFLTWLIGHSAKEDVKVMISGAGADELWGGYQRHRAFDQYLQYQEPLLVLQPLLRSLPLGRKWKKFFEGIDKDPRRTFLNFSALQAIPQDLFTDYERVFDQKLPRYKQMLDFDRQVYLVQDVLKIQDNALMAHGIEGRSPYLDEGLVQFWRSIEDDNVIKEKVWIKELLKELDLSWVAKRSKFGFGLPLQEWLSTEGPFTKKVFTSLKEFGQSHESHFSPQVKALLHHPEKHTTTHFLTLYNMFILGEWLKLQKL